MTATEEMAQIRAEIQRLQALMQQQGEQIAVLTARLAKDSHNSSNPPSSDGYRRRVRVRLAVGSSRGTQFREGPLQRLFQKMEQMRNGKAGDGHPPHRFQIGLMGTPPPEPQWHRCFGSYARRSLALAPWC